MEGRAVDGPAMCGTPAAEVAAASTGAATAGSGARGGADWKRIGPLMPWRRANTAYMALRRAVGKIGLGMVSLR